MAVKKKTPKKERFSREGQSWHKCKVCSVAIPSSDAHDKCVRCLGKHHIMNGCKICSKLSSRALQQREARLHKFLKQQKEEKRSGTVAIIEEVHGGVLPVSSSPVTWVQAVWRGAVATLQKLFFFLMMDSTPETTCKICGKACTISLELSNELIGRGNGHHEASKKMRKGKPHVRKKTCQLDNLHTLVPGPIGSAANCQEKSDTWSLSSSVCSLSSVKSSEESAHTDMSYPSVILPHNTSEQLSRCLYENGLQSGDNGLITSYSGRSTISSCSFSPSGKSSLGTMRASNSSSAASIPSLSEDEALSVCASNASEILHPSATETQGVQDCQFPETLHPSDRTSCSAQDSSSHSHIPSACLLHKAQAAKLGSLLRRRILHPLYGLPVPSAKYQQLAERKHSEEDKYTSQPFKGLMSETQCSESILTPPKNARGQSVKNEFTEMETPFLGSAIRERLEWHLKKKSLHNVWSMPATIKESLRLYMPSAPTPAVPKDAKKSAKFVPAALHKLPFLRECMRKCLDSHLGSRACERRMALPPKAQDTLRKCIPSGPRMSEPPFIFDGEKVALLPKGRPASNISGPCGVGEAKTRGPSQECQDSKALKLPTAYNERVPESNEPQLGTHLSKNRLELQKGSISVTESKSMETAYPVTKKLHRKWIYPRRACLKPRTRHVPFLDKMDVDSLEKNIKHKKLAFLWELPTIHTEYLSRMVPTSCTPVKFMEMETPFMKSDISKSLELHVQGKSLQQAVELPAKLPGTIMPTAPPLKQPKVDQNPGITIKIIRGDTPFICKEYKQQLEVHLRKEIMQHQSGVLGEASNSVRKFLPGIEPPSHTPENKYPGYCIPVPATLTPKISDLSMEFAFSRAMGEIGSLHKVQASDSRSQDIGRLETHQTEKGVETGMEGMASQVDSRRHEISVTKPKLLKLIFKGQRSVRPRGRCMPFHVKKKTLQHKWRKPASLHTSLQVFMPTAPMPIQHSTKPKLPKLIFKGQRSVRPRGRCMPFHVKKKTLQHEWGKPVFLHTSLQVFMPTAPMPIQHRKRLKSAIKLIIIRAEASFLNEDTRTYLENHVEWRIVQNAFGLPQRILEALRLFHQVPSPFHVFLTEEENISGLSFASPGQTVPGKKVHTLKTLESSMASGSLVASAGEQLQIMEKTNLQIHLGKKCLETHMETMSLSVERSMKAVYFLMKQTLPKRAYPGKMSTQSRIRVMPFIEPKSVCSLERNIKLKHLMFLWGTPTLQKESLSKMFPKILPLPKALKGSGAGIEFGEMNTAFIKPKTRECLEWHVEGRKLYQQWNLPRLVHKSLQAFVPPAPKLERPQMKVEPRLKVLNLTGDLFFMNEYIQHFLETHIKKKIVQKEIGMPQRIIEYFKSSIVCTPPMSKALMHCDDLDPIPGCSSPSVQTGKGVMGSSGSSLNLMTHTSHLRENAGFNKVTFLQKYKDENHTETNMSRNAGDKGIQTRPSDFPYMESAAVRKINLNLKQKKLAFLWGLPSQQTQLMFTILPKPSSLDPRVKPFGATIEFSQVETPFILCEFRLHMELHIKKKRLQQKCSIPPDVQKSIEAFIPSPLEIFGSRIHKQSELEVIPLTSNLLFIEVDTKAQLEFYIRKLIVQERFGLADKFKADLRKCVLPSPSTTEQAPDEDIKPPANAFPQVSKTLQAKKRSSGSQKTLLPLKCALPTGESQRNKKLEQHLTRKCLEVKMGLLPFVVEWSLRIACPTEKTNLPKQIFSKQNCQQRATRGFFLEPKNVHQVDLNIKHKQLMSLLGPVAHSVEPLNTLMPTDLFLIPQFQTKGFCIEFSEMDPPFIGSKDRETLEWHVKKKCLHRDWGLPVKIQRSLTVFMQQAPNQPQLRTRQRAPTDLIIKSGDILFLNESTRQMLGKHIISLKRHPRMTCPKKIAEAFKLSMTTVPESKPSANALDSDKPSRPQSLLQLCFKKSIKITPPSKHVPLSPEEEVQHPKLLFGRPASRHAGEKDGLLPRGVQQQQLENKLESSTVGSLMSNQLAQSVRVPKYRYMTWKNRKRKVVPSTTGTNSIIPNRTQYVTCAGKETDDSHSCQDPASLITTVAPGCKYPHPDINDIHEIAQAVEFHLHQKPAQSWLSHLSPPVDGSAKLSKPMALPSFPAEKCQQYTMVFNAMVPNVKIPPNISQLKMVIDLHLREKTLEIHCDGPHGVQESSKSTKHWLGLLLNSLPPKIHINTTLENEGIAHCHGLTQNVPTSGNDNEPCTSESTLGISAMNENQIMHNMETPFMRQKLSKCCPCAPQKSWDHGSPLPFQSSQCMCLDCRCSMSDRPAHEPHKPFSFPALNTPDGSMADISGAILQSSGEGQDTNELTIQSGHQSVRRELASDPSRQSPRETTLIYTSSKTTSPVEPSLGASVFHHLSEDVKRNLESHVQQKKTMDALILSLSAVKPRRVHQRTLTQRTGEEVTNTLTSNQRSSESKPGDRTAPSVQSSSTDDRPAQPKQVTDYPVQKKTTWLQKVTSSFRESVSKLRGRVKDKSATGGVQGLGRALDKLLYFNEATAFNHNHEILGKDEIPRRTREMQKTERQKKRKADLAHPTLDTVQPPRTITAQPSPGDPASREHGRRKEKSPMAEVYSSKLVEKRKLHLYC